MQKPTFVSEVVIKERTEIKVIYESGSGDPMKFYDPINNKLHQLLKAENVKPTGNDFGIFYVDRRKVDLSELKWDVCIPIESNFSLSEEFKTKILLKTKVASVILTGNYDLIGYAVEYLEKELESRKTKYSWPLTEIYLKYGNVPVTEIQYLVKE